MAKILNLLIGAIVAVAGAILLVTWWYEFVFTVRAILPVLLILGGGVAVFAGMSELKDTLKKVK